MKRGHSHEGKVFSIDYYAYMSRLREWQPDFKVGCAMFMLLISLIASNLYVDGLVIGMVVYLVVIKGGLPFDDYLDVLKIPLVFMILGSMAIGLNISLEAKGDYIINCRIFYLYTTREGIETLVNLWGKAFAAINAMYMMTLTTPSSEIIGVFRRLKMPKMIIELMYLIYRYIFILMDVQCKMKNAAQSRLGYCDFKTAYFSFGNIASNLLIVSLKKASAYYDAMVSRGYEGDLVFLEEEKRVTKKQLLSMGIYIVSLIVIWMLTYE